jgi:hypothetical protein
VCLHEDGSLSAYSAVNRRTVLYAPEDVRTVKMGTCSIRKNKYASESTVRLELLYPDSVDSYIFYLNHFRGPSEGLSSLEMLKSVYSEQKVRLSNKVSMDDVAEDQNLSEADRALAERILEYCTDTSIRNDVQANICYAMKRYGDKEKARKMAESLPNYYKTAQLVLPSFLEGQERQECCKSGIQMLAYCFYATVRDMLKDDIYTAEERIALRRKVLAMYELVYEDGNYLFTHTRVADLHEDIAADLMEMGNLDEGLKHWELAAEHAMAYDALPDSAPYTSLLTRDLMYVKANTSTTNEYNYAHFMLRFMQKDKLFDPVREDPRVIAIMEKLKKVAN